jgi:tripartite-type tricarboxylate transporter receptor subunit TctC
MELGNIGRRELLGLAATAAALPAVARIAFADTYPSRPVRLIVGFTAGAASDVVARIFAKAASPILGQQIVVENKPGAGSSIAAQYVSRAPNDGYTLFLPALSGLTNEVVNPSSPPLDMSKDFAPITQIAEGPYYLIVNPSLGLKSVADFIALARAKPGELTYGSVGAGSLPHLCGALLEQRTGIKMVHVPYPGSPETVTDLVANRITMSFIVGSSIQGQVQAGQLQALATSAGKRSSLMPDVPTMIESGVPDFDVTLWLGLLAPPGTASPIISALADAAHKGVAQAETAEALRKQGYEPLNVTPDEFTARLRKEIALWTTVAKSAGLLKT